MQYVEKDGPAAIAGAVSSGEAEGSMHFSGPLILRVDRESPLRSWPHPPRLLRAFHVTAASEPSRPEGADHRHSDPRRTGTCVLSSMMAHVGLDPSNDIRWVTYPAPHRSISLRRVGSTRSWGFRPSLRTSAREDRPRFVNSNVDRPWSSYFCCMLAGNRDFVRAHPVATKRALRAILKATDICAAEPDRVAV